MKSSGTRNWVELIGLAAIVASLVFVGLELRQSQNVAIASQFQERASIAADYYLTRLQSEHLIAHKGSEMTLDYESGRLGSEQEKHYEAYGADSLAVNFLHVNTVLVMLDNGYFQYQSGLLTEETWLSFRFRLKGALSNPLWAEFFLEYPEAWRRSFRELGFRLLAEIEAEKASAG